MCLTEGALSIFLPSNFRLEPIFGFNGTNGDKRKPPSSGFWLFGNRTCPAGAIRLLSGIAFDITDTELRESVSLW